MTLKVNETRRRSLLKAITHRAFEIGIATAIIHFWGKVEPELALGIAAVSEGSCFGLYYIGERIWNKVRWGRQIIKEKNEQ